MFLTVDLAAKFSAAILRDDSGEVRWQGDSGDLGPFQWVDTLSSVISAASPQHILVEDLPFGISGQGQVKKPLRLQGALMYALRDVEFFFINPSSWQKDFPGVGRSPKGLSKTEGSRYRIAKAAEYCTELGYTPPDLVSAWQEKNPELKPLRKYLDPLEKQVTDYRDAFLMNVWLQNHAGEYKTLSGVQAPFI